MKVALKDRGKCEYISKDGYNHVIESHLEIHGAKYILEKCLS